MYDLFVLLFYDLVLLLKCTCI